MNITYMIICFLCNKKKQFLLKKNVQGRPWVTRWIIPTLSCSSFLPLLEQLWIPRGIVPVTGASMALHWLLVGTRVHLLQYFWHAFPHLSWLLPVPHRLLFSHALFVSPTWMGSDNYWPLSLSKTSSLKKKSLTWTSFLTSKLSVSDLSRVVTPS